MPKPPTKDASLYDVDAPRRKMKNNKEFSLSGGGLDFASELSSLISSTSDPLASSSSAASKTSRGRARPAKKDDIFAVHNKGAKKRAQKDIDDIDFTEQKHATSGGGLTEAEQKLSRRRMEEKARRYAALARGDIEDADEKFGVDFDRKWAEEDEQAQKRWDNSSSGEESEEEEELVEYVDEFGRTRKGTRREAMLEKRRMNALNDDPDRFTARPTMPSNIIIGDTIQSSAFNPDEPIAAQMAELAAKRDRGDTPPPDTHFDASAEIRKRGTGFYAFSGDNEERQKQMDDLMKMREETERKRTEASNERKERQLKRKQELEKKKEEIKQKRARHHTTQAANDAERFLSALSKEWEETGAAPQDNEKEAGADGSIGTPSDPKPEVGNPSDDGEGHKG